jgi:hypothetical protein
MLRRLSTARRSVGLGLNHDAGRHIVVEREHGDRGLADGEGRRGDDRGKQALEPLARLGQLGRDARAPGMNFGADMVGDQPNDALAVGGRQPFTGIFDQAFREPIDPEPPVGVEHHLDDRGSSRNPRSRAERGAQHARAARYQGLRSGRPQIAERWRPDLWLFTGDAPWATIDDHLTWLP